MKIYRTHAGLIALGISLFAADAMAEGSNELVGQALVSDTVLFVDVLDASETIHFDGDGVHTVYDPQGVVLTGTPTAEGQVYTPTNAGEYRIELTQTEFEWDLRVEDGTGPVTGRVFSYAWHLNSGTYDATGALNTTFFAIVNGGDATSEDVIELQFEGLSGFDYFIAANALGVTGAERGSVDYTDLGISPGVGPDEIIGTVVPAAFPLYLSQPARGTSGIQTAGISDFSFAEDPFVLCGDEKSFTFESTTEGTFGIVCDANGDGVFSTTDPQDIALAGEASVGTNTVNWDGMANGNALVADGTMTCKATVYVGELHFVAADIETNWQGLRMFHPASVGGDAGLTMFWDDSLVQGTRDLPDGETAATTSPTDGLDSGGRMQATDAYSVERTAGNARAWGSFVEGSVGAEALLDTFTFLDSASAETQVTVIGPSSTTDSDQDTLTDYAETCDLGTDPNSNDSDGDGLTDDVETRNGRAIDTDSDGTPDVLDTDSDDDTIEDGTDNCVLIPNTDQSDLDEDGLGDVCDDETIVPDENNTNNTNNGNNTNNETPDETPEFAIEGGACSAVDGSPALLPLLVVGMFGLRRRRR